MSNSTFSGPIKSRAGVVCADNLQTTQGAAAVTATVGTTFTTYDWTALTNGTDTTPVSGTRNWARVFVPHNCTLTGISYLVGSVGGTDSVIVELKDSAGVSLANSTTAGVTVGTAATMQNVPFTAPIAVTGPAYYFVAITMNGTTARFRTIPAATYAALTQIASSATGTFATVTNLTVGTTFTADKGPIACTY